MWWTGTINWFLFSPQFFLFSIQCRIQISPYDSWLIEYICQYFEPASYGSIFYWLWTRISRIALSVVSLAIFRSVIKLCVHLKFTEVNTSEFQCIVIDRIHRYFHSFKVSSTNLLVTKKKKMSSTNPPNSSHSTENSEISSKYPTKIIETDICTTWFVHDTEPHESTPIYFIHFQSPLASGLIEKWVALIKAKHCTNSLDFSKYSIHLLHSLCSIFVVYRWISYWKRQLRI